MLSNKIIPVTVCKPGYLYKISSRNLNLGIYDGDYGFLGIRTKFGYRYLFTEYHSDMNNHCATVFPKEEICESPFTEEQVYSENKEILDWLEQKEKEIFKLPDIE